MQTSKPGSGKRFRSATWTASLSAAIGVHLWLLVVAACCVTAFAQSTVRDYRQAHERQIIDEFTHLLAIPNVAADKENIRRNSQFIFEMMQRRGLSPQLLEAKSKD